MLIVYQDPSIIVLNKPSGLPVLPDGWEKDSEYLVKMLEEKYGKIFIVHRLDKITSGVMVFARDAETHRTLNMQFEHHEAQKVYHAIVEGNPGGRRRSRSFPCMPMWDINIAPLLTIKTVNHPRQDSKL